jgi:hypothetical protein
MENGLEQHSSDTHPIRSDSEPSPLYALGKRMERLQILGIILTAFCLFEYYLVTANYLISQDRSINTISSILVELRGQESVLDKLYALKSSPQPSSFPSGNDESERVLATRKMLGLRPPVARKSTDTNSPKSYDEALDRIFSKVLSRPDAGSIDTVALRDLKPDALIKKLEQMRGALEQQPTNVWGIEMPRLLNFEYAGTDYRVPFGFLSTVFAATLTPLIAGWLSVLYMTRQRELVEIRRATDFMNVYPHILNFVPFFIRFQRVLSPGEQAFQRRFLATLRVIVLSVLIFPTLFAHGSSLIWLQLTDGSDLSLLFWVSIAFAIYVFFQVFSLLLQECLLLANKQFAFELVAQ